MLSINNSGNQLKKKKKEHLERSKIKRNLIEVFKTVKYVVKTDQSFLFMLSHNTATTCQLRKLMAGKFRSNERISFFTQHGTSLWNSLPQQVAGTSMVAGKQLDKFMTTYHHL